MRYEKMIAAYPTSKKGIHRFGHHEIYFCHLLDILVCSLSQADSAVEGTVLEKEHRHRVHIHIHRRGQPKKELERVDGKRTNPLTLAQMMEQLTLCK